MNGLQRFVRLRKLPNCLKNRIKCYKSERLTISTSVSLCRTLAAALSMSTSPGHSFLSTVRFSAAVLEHFTGSGIPAGGHLETEVFQPEAEISDRLFMESFTAFFAKAIRFSGVISSVIARSFPFVLETVRVEDSCFASFSVSLDPFLEPATRFRGFLGAGGGREAGIRDSRGRVQRLTAT
jgi:hypothetical protein